MKAPQRIIEINRSAERRIAAYCLEIAGGGYNPQQVAKAMTYQRTLVAEGKLKVGRITLVLTSPEEATS